MKLMHISDLHLGKRISEISLIEDQAYILQQILQQVEQQQPDGMLIAGDVYDKSTPSAEAVNLLDDFLTRLSQLEVPTFLISGNHDSADRLAFAHRLVTARGIHISPVYDGRIAPVTLEDGYGPVHIYLLPFLKPNQVRQAFPDAEIESYTDAVAKAIQEMQLDTSARNVLVSHQFVAGATRSDSELISVGGSDNVAHTVYAPFDYVALGHIHGPQSVGRETIRYCGTPLKYSYSEIQQQKSITMVELQQKGTVTIQTIPLQPLRDMRELRGTYSQLTSREQYINTAVEDYLHVILTDEEDVVDAFGRLSAIYPNILGLEYDNTRTRHQTDADAFLYEETQSPFALFSDFFEKQNGKPMSQEQTAYMTKLLDTVMEDSQ